MSISYIPKYTNIDAIKDEIGSKVGYSNSDNRFPDDITIAGYIKNAENYIERKLSRLYVVPFTADDGDSFLDISDVGTQQAIIDACTWRSALLIMRTSFGASTGVRGEDFIEYLQQSLDDFIEVESAQNKLRQFVNPSMLGLKLNPTAAFYEIAAMPAPRTVNLGSRSDNIGIRSQRHLTNPNRSWQSYFRGRHCR